jgi:pre-rRNA-processing protein TSR3
MQTLILRHQRENLKKCSLRGLEGNPEFRFLTYPRTDLPDLSNYVLLALDGEPLSPKDKDQGIFLLDATWRYAQKMRSFVEKIAGTTLKTRSIPSGFKTAYPRSQSDCPDPEAGLASIEALYIAFWLSGRDPSTLLNHYHWKEDFLAKNNFPIL